MGTIWKINFVNECIDKNILIKAIEQQIYEDNKKLSFWENNSDISKFNNYKSTKPQRIDKNLAKIISVALLIGKKTFNALDITVGTLVNLWGFGPKMIPRSIPKPRQIKNALTLTGPKHIQLIQQHRKYYLKKNIKDTILDLSTLGEGFIADHLGELLKKYNIQDFTISVGGAIVTHIKNQFSDPKMIAIQEPTDKITKIHTIVKLKNNAISTSGTYRNYFYLEGRKVTHIINPVTGNPIATNLISVSVITKSALESDAWDTGLMILGFNRAKKLAIKERLAVCLIKRHKSALFTWISPQFRLFLKDNILKTYFI